jgi:hypothetical protein
MSDLTSQVLEHLDSSGLEAIAARLGVDPAQAEAAVRQAVPLVVGGLARTASTESGAAAVHETAAAHAGMDLGSLLGGLFGGAGGSGGAILGQIFGNRQDQAAQGLGQASGLGAGNAGQLLAMLAPIVMSVLGNMSRKQDLGPGGLGDVLGGELGRLGGQGGLLGSLLDRDGDGQLGLGDLLKAGGELLGARNRA